MRLVHSFNYQFSVWEIDIITTAMAKLFKFSLVLLGTHEFSYIMIQSVTAVTVISIILIL